MQALYVQKIKPAKVIQLLKVVVVVVAESPVSSRWRGWKEGVKAGTSLHREDRRMAGFSGTPLPRRCAATNPQVSGSPGVVSTQTVRVFSAVGHLAVGQFAVRKTISFG